MSSVLIRHLRGVAGHAETADEFTVLTSAYLSHAKPVAVILKELPWGTHYQLKAYPFDLRDQFNFISDMTVRGKLAVAETGGVEITAPAAFTDKQVRRT